MVSSEMKFSFSNVHRDGDIRTTWDLKLRVVGDFAVWSEDRVIYRKPEFCLIEFAIALAKWLVLATDLGPDFIYTSLESETEGLIRFQRQTSGMWQVSTAYQNEEAVPVTTAQLKNAATTYMRELRRALLPEIELMEFVDDRRVRETVQSSSE
jgi:hypothetical protein